MKIVDNSTIESKQNANHVKILLYQIRTELNLTPEDVARLSGVSVASIKRYEAGTVDPPVQKLAKIAHTLGYNVYDLIEDTYISEEFCHKLTNKNEY